MSEKPKLQPDDLDLAFYQAIAAHGVLCLQNCADCGHWTHPARYFCPNCSSENYRFQPVDGGAEIHSYTVSHYTVDRAWKDRVPYAAIVAETKEGPRVLARTNLPREAIRIGEKIRLRVEVIDSEFSYVWAEAAQE